MSSQSVKVRIEVERIGSLRAELKRFLAPLTFDEVVRRLPLGGPAAKWEHAVYFPVDIRRGAEKTVYSISPGDILYWASGPAIVLVIRKGPIPPNSVKLGVVLDDCSVLENVRPGDQIVMRREQ